MVYLCLNTVCSLSNYNSREAECGHTPKLDQLTQVEKEQSVMINVMMLTGLVVGPNPMTGILIK